MTMKDPKVIPKWTQSHPNVTPKSSQRDPTVIPKWPQSHPKWSQSHPMWCPNYSKIIPKWRHSDRSMIPQWHTRMTCMHDMHAWQHVMHARHACMSCMHAMHACHACMSCMHVKHACHACMSCMWCKHVIFTSFWNLYGVILVYFGIILVSFCHDFGAFGTPWEASRAPLDAQWRCWPSFRVTSGFATKTSILVEAFTEKWKGGPQNSSASTIFVEKG